MARKNPYINYSPKKIAKQKPKGYALKIHLKLSKRVHSDFKKLGIKSSWNESQKFASRVLYERYKDSYVSNIDFRDVDLITQETVKKESKVNLPIKEIVEECGSVFRVPEADLIDIDFWAIGDAISRIPGDVKIRVSGGSYGGTGIDKQINFNYHSNGISTIVANIRPDAKENYSDIVWVGLRKLVPGRSDNGKECNYFIDFVLEINGEFVSLSGTEVERKEVFGLTPEEIQQRQLTKKQIGKEVEKRREQAKIDAAKKREEQAKIDAAKKRKRPTAAPKEEPKQSVIFNLNEALDKLYEEYKLGIYDVNEYKKEKSKLIKLAEKLSN